MRRFIKRAMNVRVPFLRPAQRSVFPLKRPVDESGVIAVSLSNGQLPISY